MGTDRTAPAVVVTVDGWRFTYDGGRDIAVTIPAQAHPEQFIDVSDADTGRPSIDCSPEAVEAVARAWLEVADTRGLFLDRDPRYTAR